MVSLFRLKVYIIIIWFQLFAILDVEPISWFISCRLNLLILSVLFAGLMVWIFEIIHLQYRERNFILSNEQSVILNSL